MPNGLILFLACWLLFLGLLRGALPVAPRACPHCHHPARRTVLAALPIWSCQNHDAIAPFGLWAPLAIWLWDRLQGRFYAFLICDDRPFWYLVALWRLASGQGIEFED